MFQSPDHYHNLSLRLSEVLDDIGVNERIVMRRRKSFFLREKIMNMHNQINTPNHLNTPIISTFLFGSQIEGSTTLGLKSDIDTLNCYFINRIYVMQDWSEWRPGNVQLQMVQDETTPPGYCLLQAVRPDLPLPYQDIQRSLFKTDSRGRLLLTHSCAFEGIENCSLTSVRHGPARTVKGGPHEIEMDYVWALHCSYWPSEAKSWLQRQNISGWPTADIKRYAVEHGCFVVAVSSQRNRNEDTEFRISTSHAERCLMLSLNMTQMRCYILMKMINKTFLKPKCEDTISSFMCKTVLFHCIADTRASEWNDSNLLPCLNKCLQYLLQCISTGNCPHFIIPGNNLLAGKLSYQTKQQLVEIMMTLTTSIEQSLLGISIDQVGNRLHVKSGGILPNHLPPPELIAANLLQTNANLLASGLQRVKTQSILKWNSRFNFVVVYRNLEKYVLKLCTIYSAGSRLERAACCHYATLICSTIGSVIASVNIHHSQTVSPAALQWFSAGLNSDFSSSRLKLASALYCAGQYEQCETILVHLNTQLEQTTVETLCTCFKHDTFGTLEFGRICQEKNDEDVMKQNIAFCVIFLPCEVNCVPKELRYEMLRYKEDLTYTGKDYYWMYWAVDSIPFQHFLQYKACKQDHRPAEQQQALDNLARTITTDLNLGHRETALNLLGQCMKEENRKNAALRCYTMSLKVRPQNNVAKWHICILLARTFNNSFSRH